MKSPIRKIALCGMMLALGLICSYVEYKIPFGNLGIPGLKIGLANTVVTLLLYALPLPYALSVALLRVTLSSLLFGLSTFPYSLGGCVVSFTVMVLLRRVGRFSPIGVSAAGGAAHTVGQVAVAMLIMENYRIVFYLPPLLVTGSITGALVGYLTKRILPVIQKQR